MAPQRRAAISHHEQGAGVLPPRPGAPSWPCQARVGAPRGFGGLGTDPGRCLLVVLVETQRALRCAQHRHPVQLPTRCILL